MASLPPGVYASGGRLDPAAIQRNLKAQAWAAGVSLRHLQISFKVNLAPRPTLAEAGLGETACPCGEPAGAITASGPRCRGCVPPGA